MFSTPSAGPYVSRVRDKKFHKRKEVPARCATLRQGIHQTNNAFADKEVKEGIEGVYATNKSL